MTVELRFMMILSMKPESKWMQAFDVFEPFKVIGEAWLLNVPIKDEDDVMKADHALVYELATSIIKQTVEQGKKHNKIGVVFMRFKEARFDDMALMNPDDKRVAPYRDPTVKVISNGEGWILLDEAIAQIMKS